MEKRICRHGNGLLCEVLIVLTETQKEKLECPELRDKIDKIADEMHLQGWHVEKASQYIGVISIYFDKCILSDDQHQAEITATNFMSAVDELNAPENKDLIDFDENPEDKEILGPLPFVKNLLHDMNLPKTDDRHVCGALIIDATTHPLLIEPTCWGHLSYDTLKEMCELYIKAHE